MLRVTRKIPCLTEMRLERLYEQEIEASANVKDQDLDVPSSPLLPIREIHFDLPIYLD
jgi:hypothetical protein